MGASGAIKDFVFEGEDGQAQKIDKIVPVNTFLVQYFDHEGKQQTRLVAREPATGTAFIINGQIQGQPVLIPATKWFQNQLKERLDANKGAESI
jgi:hypothetical protein